MKIFLILSFLIISIFASEVSTKDDINLLRDDMRTGFREVRKDMRENNRILLEVMNKRFEAVDKRFEAVDKRFEAVDKRFEDMQKYMDKRFETAQISMDKRFEAVDKRFEFMQNLMMGLIASIFVAIGYMFWDRQKSFKEAKEEYKKELNAQLIKKADKKTLEEVITIIEELANKDDVVKDILARHHLRVVEG